MMSSVPDAHFMSRSLQDPEAFGEIFDRHAATILRYLVRRVGRPTAEGVLGEVFRIAFERRASFDTAHASARPWLYGISANLLLKHRRTEARRLSTTARAATEWGLAHGPAARKAADSVTEVVDARILLDRVAEALSMLPDPEREALLLFAWEDLGYDDIARALDVPIGTVRSRLNRARTRLRELVSGNGKPQPSPQTGEPARRRR